MFAYDHRNYRYILVDFTNVRELKKRSTLAFSIVNARCSSDLRKFNRSVVWIDLKPMY